MGGGGSSGLAIGTTAGTARDAAAAITAEQGALTAANVNKPAVDCRFFGCQATGALVTVQSKLGISTPTGWPRLNPVA